MSNKSQDLEIVKSIIRASDIIKCLNKGESRFTDVCKRLNLSKSTVHRLLKTLEAAGLVVQDPISRQYYLGHVLISLASNSATLHQMLVVSSIDEMKHLRDFSGETVAIQIRVGIQKLVLEEIESTQGAKFALGKGHVEPLLTGAGGIVLFAGLEGNEFESVIKRIDSNKSFKPIDRVYLTKELSDFNLKGYATNCNESLGIVSVAVPIMNYICPVALTIIGLKGRFTQIDYVQLEMKKSAVRISQKLLELETK